MRTWMRVAGLAVVLVLAGGVRSDDPIKQGDKPRTDDKAKSDDKALTDTHFVDHAYTDGQNEVILARLALERSRNEDVRKFAMRMIDDHNKANQDLILVVSDLRIAVPDKPLPDQEKELRKLHDGAIKDFDKEYIDQMVKKHEGATKLFEQAAKELKNERLREFAKNTLPTIKDHLKMAKDVQDKLAKGGK